MQNRKIAVPIKTIDDKHCSKKCEEFWPEECNACAYCKQFRENLVFDKKGYLRTKQCIKREIKEEK